MHCGIALVALVALVASASAFNIFNPFSLNSVGSANGGSNCATCTVMIAMLEQRASVHNASVSDTIAEICDFLPAGVVQDACKGLVEEFGPEVIDLLDAKETPDVVCTALGFCTGVCRLFPQPTTGMEASIVRAKAMIATRRVGGLPAFCSNKLLEPLCNLVNNFANNHLPVVDFDNDTFSDVPTLRGSDWRGKDCNDQRADYHPGALPIDWDVEEDSNCNGILGTNPNTGIPYEQELCSGANTPKGMAVLGDSASAHFHIPPDYFEPGTWVHGVTFKEILHILENEFDWPMFSAYTGHLNTSMFNPVDIEGPVNSTYAILNSVNRCNHRDFQNIGVNGARESDADNTLKYVLNRNQTTDYPIFVMIAMIGNDVCNGNSENTLSSMTTTESMYNSAMGTLTYLNTKLPAGSNVAFLGLADGRILYEALANRTHPLGMWFNNLQYHTLYDYLNCLQISPCSGWMNSNATLRQLTTDRAVNLSLVLENIANTETFENFNLHYIPNPIDAIIANWVAHGGEAWQLIEPVDGFHPNQYAMSLLAASIGDWLQANATSVLGQTNPNNDLISTMFGDQGGY